MYADLKKKIAELEQKEEEAITHNNVKLQKLFSERLKAAQTKLEKLFSESLKAERERLEAERERLEAMWEDACDNKDEARMYHFERQLDKLYGFSSSSSSSGKTTLVQAKCVYVCVCVVLQY